ncbi:MAG TPA: hypothetical protein VF254_11450 [Gammaproteobacteria bacterium]
MNSNHNNVKRYELVAVDAVRQEFGRMQGIIKYGYTIGFDNRAQVFFLLRENGTGFQVFTDMVALGPRLEAGRINIGRAEDWKYSIAQIKTLPPEFTGVQFNVDRLVTTDEAGRVDSGLSLRTSKGNEMILVASSAPLGIECFSKPHIPVPDEKFEPEYELHEYQREPFIL